jgi:energy-coupling factor transport system ATP-binding protein
LRASTRQYRLQVLFVMEGLVTDVPLECSGLTYSYPGAPEAALDGVDLKLREGELVLVTGGSASGKSSLLRAASGLVPHFYGGRLAGRVVVGGLDTRSSGPSQIAAIAGSLFQDPESQVVMTSVRSELRLPLENRGLPEASIARSVEETAIALGIAGLLERSLDSLSSGELQRVALGAALVGEPRLLLLDEPTSQLDPVAGDELIWQLRRLNEEWGVTVVLAEHRVERCLAAADRVVTLERGRVQFDGPPQEFVAWAAEQAPELAPPVASMCAQAGLAPIPIGVKDGRALLRARGFIDTGEGGKPDVEAERPRLRAGRALAQPARRLLRSRRVATEAALELARVWVSYDDGTGAGLEALRGLTLSVGRGETVALLGRNGAGKSTLLRVAAGLRVPDRGRLRTAGEVALVLPNAGDYFLHERVREELPDQWASPALAEVGLSAKGDADPRDLSGGERQRLALAIVLAGRGIGGGAPPAVVALDEPTRGMDRGSKQALAQRLRSLSSRGAAVIVATHDVEFAARAADRCVLLAAGRVVADGRTEEALSGGRYFATEVARVFGRAARVVLPEEGARLLAEGAGVDRAASPAGDHRAVRVVSGS